MIEARVLVFAGLDPSGRAGLLADGKAVRAAGAHPVLCATAVAAQSSGRLVRLSPVGAETIAAQAEAALEDGPIAAVKLGMIGTLEVRDALVALLRGPLARVPIVVDPVLETSRGGRLFEGGPRDYLPLIDCADVVTPNLVEAAALTGLPCAREDEMLPAALALGEVGARAVLLKGGHLAGPPADLLWSGGQARWLRGERIAHVKRGTGCRLASGVAARLALGRTLEQSVAEAAAWLRGWLIS